MDNTEMQRRIDAAFEFVGRVVERPDRFPDEAVLFLMNPAEVASVLTKERLRMLAKLEANDYPTLVALADALGRDVSRVRKDLLTLERLGLVTLSKSGNRIRARPAATGIYIPLFSSTGRRTAVKTATKRATA